MKAKRKKCNLVDNPTIAMTTPLLDTVETMMMVLDRDKNSYTLWVDTSVSYISLVELSNGELATYIYICTVVISLNGFESLCLARGVSCLSVALCVERLPGMAVALCTADVSSLQAPECKNFMMCARCWSPELDATVAAVVDERFQEIDSLQIARVECGTMLLLWCLHVPMRVEEFLEPFVSLKGIMLEPWPLSAAEGIRYIRSQVEHIPGAYEVERVHFV